MADLLAGLIEKYALTLDIDNMTPTVENAVSGEDDLAPNKEILERTVEKGKAA